MKLIKIFTFLFISFILKAQWIQQNGAQLPSYYTGYAIEAADSQTAVIAIYNVSVNFQIYKTVNGGESWFELPQPDLQGQQFSPSDLTMVGNNDLWVCTTGPAKIFFTEDDGATWVEQFYDSTVTDFFNYIEMFDENNGIAMGDALSWGNGPAIILRTMDGGSNWISVNDSAFGGISGDMWRRIDFVNQDIGYFYPSGSSFYLLYKTIDGGSSWWATNHPQTGVEILKFFNENLGFTANSLALYRTFDGGIIWDSLASPGIDDWMMDMEFAPDDSSKIWLASNQNIYYSNDFGDTWVTQLGPTGIRDVVFTDSLNGWVLCDNDIYRTSNGGQLLTVKDDQFRPDQYVLYPNYPNPFNPFTTLRYDLPEKIHVNLTIYDLLGRQIITLVNETQEAGYKSVIWDASGISGGIYIYRIKAGNFTQTRKLVLLK